MGVVAGICPNRTGVDYGETSAGRTWFLFWLCAGRGHRAVGDGCLGGKVLSLSRTTLLRGVTPGGRSIWLDYNEVSLTHVYVEIGV